MRYKNIEFRRAGVADSKGHMTSLRDPEIIAWVQRDGGKETCYTICWFKENEVDWYMETVGNRFTEYEEEYPLIHVARYALRVLNLEKQFHEGCY